MALQVILDQAQNRLADDSLSTLVSGLDWDLPNSTNIFVDGVTNTAMLTPAPFSDTWTTSNTGIDAKLAASNLVLTDSANWLNNAPDGSGPFLNYKVAGGNVSGIGGHTTATQPKNQPMVVEWYNPGVTSSSGGVFECGWSSTGDGSVGVSLRFYADGRAEVWKAGAMVGQYSVAGKTQEYFSPQSSGQIIFGQSLAQYVSISLIPCRGRELLVLASSGGGFSHIFEDIPEGMSSPTITDAAPFWFFVPAKYEPNVRLAVLQYAATGTLIGQKSFWRYELPAGASPTIDVYQDPNAPAATGSIKDGVNPASAYVNNTNGVRISIAMAGGSGQSSFVYGARAYTDPVSKPTFAADIDVSQYVREISLEESDSPSGKSGHIILMGRDALAALGAPSVDTMTHRPALILFGGTPAFDAVLLRPKWTDAYGYDAASADINQDIEIEIKSTWELAEDALISDPLPLDGMPLDDAYSLVASLCGRTANVSPSYHSFLLPDTGAASGGEWNVLMETGDKVSEWLDRLAKTYASTAYHGVDPNGVFELLDVSDLSPSPAAILFETIELAEAAGYSPGKYFVFRSYFEQSIEPEANDVYVTGVDFRTQRPIVVHKRDTASVDPTLAPSARPDNWLGEVRKYGWIDPTIATTEAATFALDKMYARLTPRRALGEIDCELQFNPATGYPISRKDIIELHFADGTVKSGRVKTTSVQPQQEDPRFGHWRPAHYVICLGGDASPLHTRGATVSSIAKEWKVRAFSKQIFWLKTERHQKAMKRPILAQVEA